MLLGFFIPEICVRHIFRHEYEVRASKYIEKLNKNTSLRTIGTFLDRTPIPESISCSLNHKINKFK